VERALNKLHVVLTQRGLTSTTAALGLALGNPIGVAAPAGLAGTVVGAAMASVATGGGAALAISTLLTMSTIKVGIAGAVVATLLVMGIVEFQTHQALGAELKALRVASEDPLSLQKESRQLNTSLQKLGVKNSEIGELLQLNQRMTVLRARPDGVVDSEMKPAATWSNVGRATPDAALETLHWAMFNGDLDAVASLICFDDDTPENREKFMARFGDAVRTRYRTPERLFAAMLFSGGEKTGRPDDAMQIIGVDDHVGGNGTRFGQKRVRVWYRMASGDEFESGSRWQPADGGWAIAAFSLSGGGEDVLRAIDPVTGDRRPATAGEHLPLKK